MVPLHKGPPCSHTKNVTQESVPVLTGNFMCMGAGGWGGVENGTKTTQRTLKLEVALQIIQFCSQNFIDEEN